MACIAKHRSKDERKRDYNKWRRIQLAIAGHTVRVDKVLECSRVLAGSVEGGRSFAGLHSIQNRRHTGAGPFGSASQRQLNTFQITQRTPAFGNQTFLGDVQIEHV